jgi:hypothetical protein
MDIEKLTKICQRANGMMKFFDQLYKMNMLTAGTMKLIIDDLFSSVSEENIERKYMLLTTIAQQKFERTMSYKNGLDKFMQELKSLSVIR